MKNTKHNDQPVNPSPPRGAQTPAGATRKLFVQFEVTPDEFVLYNWCRLNHRPATLAEWGKTITRRAALDQVREAIGHGEKLKQHVIEALEDRKSVV